MRSGRTPERATRGALAAFVTAGIGGVGFAVAYLLDAGNVWYGAALLLAFGGLGHGLIAWAHRLMPAGGQVEERPHVAVPPEAERAAAQVLETGASEVSRRRLLGGAFTGALGATGLSLALPLGSLGPPPLESLRHTSWREGTRLVDESGEPLRPDDLAVGQLLTVFPEGHLHAADSQTLLIRLPAGIRLQEPAAEAWTVDGLIAYSKVCTHAGCPVGLYEAATQELFCPCHQSAFDVVAGAIPTMGPAVRALPQLPLGVDDDGHLVAAGDFRDAVGPGWWSRP